MKFLSDYHTHTLLSDAAHSPEQMVAAAVGRGLKAFGISDHADMSFPITWCLTPKNTERFFSEMAVLKKKYDGIIELYAGLEVDAFSLPVSGADYIIGSQHFIKEGNDFLIVDLSPQESDRIVAQFYGGDPYSYCEAYYRQISDIVRTTGADIIGHFDIITKYNEGGRMFDESHPRYVTAAIDAVRTLAGFGKPFEINTGAIPRGCRSVPYPAPFILREIKRLGGQIMLNSDAHRTENICARFDDAEALARECGFDSSVVIRGGKFVEERL